jgi:hypothetical protein
MVRVRYSTILVWYSMVRVKYSMVCVQYSTVRILSVFCDGHLQYLKYIYFFIQCHHMSLMDFVVSLPAVAVV